MSINFSKKTEMQSNGADAVIENPKLPRMSDRAPRPRRINQEIKLMDEDPQPDQGGKNRMEPVPKGSSKRGKSRASLPDQEAKDSAAREGESYIRMRVRVENGEMSVVGMREVEGPLIQPDTLSTGFVYEVTSRNRRVAVGAVPDLGERRSFPGPSDAPELHGHYVSSVPSVEFNVKVASSALTIAALPRTAIALYQVKQGAMNALMRPGILSEQFDRELRELARLEGIRVDKLPTAVQSEIRRALK